MTKEQLITQINSDIKRLGSQKAFAAQYGISESYLSDILSGRRAPGAGLLRAYGLRVEVQYIRIHSNSRKAAK